MLTIKNKKARLQKANGLNYYLIKNILLYLNGAP